ncbi:MAG: hypothetical protein WBO38_15600 [Chitinophagaceae bacterium]
MNLFQPLLVLGAGLPTGNRHSYTHILIQEIRLARKNRITANGE